MNGLLSVTKPLAVIAAGSPGIAAHATAQLALVSEFCSSGAWCVMPSQPPPISAAIGLAIALPPMCIAKGAHNIANAISRVDRARVISAL